MFTVIEGEPVAHRHHSGATRDYYTFPIAAWVVWCGWKNEYSATWPTLEEACRDAALKQWHYQLATDRATAADRRSR